MWCHIMFQAFPYFTSCHSNANQFDLRREQMIHKAVILILRGLWKAQRKRLLLHQRCVRLSESRPTLCLITSSLSLSFYFFHTTDTIVKQHTDRTTQTHKLYLHTIHEHICLQIPYSWQHLLSGIESVIYIYLFFVWTFCAWNKV